MKPQAFLKWLNYPWSLVAVDVCLFEVRGRCVDVGDCCEAASIGGSYDSSTFHCPLVCLGGVEPSERGTPKLLENILCVLNFQIQAEK